MDKYSFRIWDENGESRQRIVKPYEKLDQEHKDILDREVKLSVVLKRRGNHKEEDITIDIPMNLLPEEFTNYFRMEFGYKEEKVIRMPHPLWMDDGRHSYDVIVTVEHNGHKQHMFFGIYNQVCKEAEKVYVFSRGWTPIKF